MFLVVTKFLGQVHFAKKGVDPRARAGYKEESQSILAIVELTALGDQQTLDTLRDMWLEHLFDRPSPFKAKPVEPPKALPKPPKKQIVGEA